MNNANSPEFSILEPSILPEELNAWMLEETSQLLAALRADENMASPRELLRATVTEEDLEQEKAARIAITGGIVLLSEHQSLTAASSAALAEMSEQDILVEGVMTRKAAMLRSYGDHVVQTPDELLHWTRLMTDIDIQELCDRPFITYGGYGKKSTREVHPSPRTAAKQPKNELFNTAMLIVKSNPEHEEGLGTAIARYLGTEFTTDAVRGIRRVLSTEVSKEFSRDLSDIPDTGAAKGNTRFMHALLRNEREKSIVSTPSINALVTKLSLTSVSTETTEIFNDASKIIDMYREGTLLPNKDSQRLTTEKCFSAATTIAANMINFAATISPLDSNSSKIANLLAKQNRVGRKSFSHDTVFVALAKGIMEGDRNNNKLSGDSLKDVGTAIDVVTSAAFDDIRLTSETAKTFENAADCLSKVLEIGIALDSFLMPLARVKDLSPSGVIPRIRQATRAQRRIAYDKHIPGYGKIS